MTKSNKSHVVSDQDVSKHNIKESSGWLLLVLALLLAGATLVSFLIGQYGISLSDFIATVFPGSFKLSPEADPTTLSTVIFQVRFPRVIAALLVGAALALSGAAYQGIFRNPMVSPDILGASSGSGLGAALGILLSMGTETVQLMAFAGGLAAVFGSYALSMSFSRGREGQVLILVLTGMVIGTLCTSFTSLTKYVADPYSKLPAITFWLMGGLASVSVDDLPRLLIPCLLAGTPLVLIRWRLNILAFGEEEARSMGLNPARLRAISIICATLLTSAAVSVAGLVGWVGLVVPHLARLVAGPNYRRVIPVSLLLGGIFLLAVDDLARNLFAMEIPLGILTSMVGAPFFIFLMARNKRSLAL
jgi:iron complex transport system permease protein